MHAIVLNAHRHGQLQLLIFILRLRPLMHRHLLWQPLMGNALLWQAPPCVCFEGRVLCMLEAPKVAAVTLTLMECSFQGAGLQGCMQLCVFQLLWTLPMVAASSGLRCVQTCRQPLSCPHAPHPGG